MLTDRELDLLQVEVQSYIKRLLEEYERTRLGSRGEVGYGAAQELPGEGGRRPDLNSEQTQYDDTATINI